MFQENLAASLVCLRALELVSIFCYYVPSLKLVSGASIGPEGIN